MLMALSRRFWPGAAIRAEVGPIRQDPELRLAAAIIVITTLMAAITTNIGIFVLQWGGWI